MVGNTREWSSDQKQRPQPRPRRKQYRPTFSPPFPIEEAPKRKQTPEGDKSLPQAGPTYAYAQTCAPCRLLTDSFEPNLRESDLSPNVRPGYYDLYMLRRIRRVRWRSHDLRRVKNSVPAAVDAAPAIATPSRYTPLLTSQTPGQQAESCGCTCSRWQDHSRKVNGDTPLVETSMDCPPPPNSPVSPMASPTALPGKVEVQPKARANRSKNCGTNRRMAYLELLQRCRRDKVHSAQRGRMDHFRSRDDFAIRRPSNTERRNLEASRRKSIGGRVISRIVSDMSGHSECG